jgi:hypothetical protein
MAGVRRGALCELAAVERALWLADDYRVEVAAGL